TEQNIKLPLATLIVKGISDFLVEWWWALTLGTIALVLGVGAFLRTTRGKWMWHRLQLRIPLVGDLIRKQWIVRIAVVTSTLLKSGVVFVRALQIAQRSTRNL